MRLGMCMVYDDSECMNPHIQPPAAYPASIALVPLATHVGDFMTSIPRDGQAHNGKSDIPVMHKAPCCNVP